IQHDVDSGRAALNFSEWDAPQPQAQLAAARVADGSMPPAWSGLLDSRMQLSDSERATLARGLQLTFNTVPGSNVQSTGSSDSFGPLLLVGIVAVAAVLAFAVVDRRHSQLVPPISTRRLES